MLDQFVFEYPDFAKTSGVKTALIVNDELGTWQSYAWIDGKNYVYIRQPGVIDDLSVPIKAARDTWNELMRSGFRVVDKGFSL
jgi:hypothetical protein|tara:strand:- start:299 stop:547 length:249 start_codon:yes stop_codon:yes gene_type:complete